VPQVVIIGAGGHARVVADAMQACGVLLTGFVTPEIERAFGVLEGIERIGDDKDLLARNPRDFVLVNGVGSTGSPHARRDVFVKFKSAGFSFASIVHPRAIVASHVSMGEGAQIMAGAVVQTGVRIGANSIVNTGAIVDHDTCLGDHVHVGPGAALSGDVIVGAVSHIGSGASVIQGRRIGDEVVVGAGAAVVSNVESGSTVVGVPARSIGRADARSLIR